MPCCGIKRGRAGEDGAGYLERVLMLQYLGQERDWSEVS